MTTNGPSSELHVAALEARARAAEERADAAEDALRVFMLAVAKGTSVPDVLAGPCTGLTARWCPVHGLCQCDTTDFADLDDDPTCPLHGHSSDHPRVPLS